MFSYVSSQPRCYFLQKRHSDWTSATEAVRFIKINNIATSRYLAVNLSNCSKEEKKRERTRKTSFHGLLKLLHNETRRAQAKGGVNAARMSHTNTCCRSLPRTQTYTLCDGRRRRLCVELSWAATSNYAGMELLALPSLLLFAGFLRWCLQPAASQQQCVRLFVCVWSHRSKLLRKKAAKVEFLVFTPEPVTEGSAILYTIPAPLKH